MSNYTKKELVDFIAENYRRKNGKRPTKRELLKLTSKELQKIISDSNGEKLLESWAKQPKMITFYADAIDQDNKEYVLEAKGTSAKEIEEDLKKQGHSVKIVVEKKGHHLCKYCNGIVDGSKTDLLCNDCQEQFGRQFYSEL